MSLESFCANAACRRRYLLPSTSAGKSIRCSACGETFIASSSATINEQKKSDDFNEPAWGAAAPQAPVVPAATGSGTNTVGRFVIRRKLGAGAFGTVYQAYDPQLDRVVALKVPNPGVMADAKRAERFLREAKAAAGLRHPHIVPVFDAGQDADRYYIATAFIDGKPLSESIEETGTDFTRAARLARELAEALAYAHEQGVVHRDVKPQNVMIDRQDRVHLMDFGLAARQEEEARLTNDGAVMGTPSYMAPEQAAGQKGEAQPFADQYAVGVVLYELLTGRTPFSGPIAVVIHNQIHTQPDTPTKHRVDVPRDLETICLKALSKRPEDRYATCQELADDLRRWVAGEPVDARPLRPWERAVRWVKKEPRLAAALGAVALVLLVSVVWVSAAARRADAARRDAEAALAQAEQDAADRKAAEDREKAAFAASGEALGTAVQERNKADAERKRADDERKRADAFQRQAEDERKIAESQREEAEKERLLLAEERARAEQFRAALLILPQSSVLTWAAYREEQNGNRPIAQSLLDAVHPGDRGWEWQYVQKLCRGTRCRTTLTFKGPAGQVRPVLSPDGTRVVTADTDGAVLWDGKSGAEIIRIKGSFGGFSTDGTRIITYLDAGNRGVRLWDAKTGTEVADVKNKIYVSNVHHLAFNSDGSWAVDTGGRVWNVKSGDEVGYRDLPQHHWSVLSPDGTRVVSCAGDEVLWVWDAKTKTKRTLATLVKTPASAYGSYSAGGAFSPDGTRFVATGYVTPWSTLVPTQTKLWDATTWKEVALVQGAYVAFSPDGTRFVTYSHTEWTVQVWNAKSGALVAVLKGSKMNTQFGAMLRAAFNPSGVRLATANTGSKTVRIWEVNTGTGLLELSFPAEVTALAWTSDGTCLAVGLADGTVVIHDGSPAPAPKP